MSETHGAQDTEPLLTAGAMLRSARQAQGLHLAVLALQLKVTPRKLEALEADRHEELQGPTFVRALAQATCRALRIDPAPVLARLPAVAQHTLDQVSGGLNAPFRERGGRGDVFELTKGARLALGAVLLLLSAALALWFVPEDTRWPWSAGPVAAASSPAESAELPPPASAAATVLTPVLRAGQGEAAAVVSEAASAARVLPAATPPAPLLQVRAESESWVDVTDASGASLLSRTLQPGETMDINGVLPLRVKIGNAAGTQLTFRGQAMDLASYTRDNIARLELK